MSRKRNDRDNVFNDGDRGAPVQFGTMAPPMVSHQTSRENNFHQEERRDWNSFEGGRGDGFQMMDQGFSRGFDRRESERMNVGQQRISPSRHVRYRASPEKPLRQRHSPSPPRRVRLMDLDTVNYQKASRPRSLEGERGFTGKRMRPGSPQGGQVTTMGSSFAGCNIQEEFPPYGVKGVVNKLLSSTTGQISILNSGKQIVHFHVNQVWLHNGYTHGQLLETFPLSELSRKFGEGTEVVLNARRLSGVKFELQATAVWLSRDPPDNLQYKTPELLTDLTLRVKELVYYENPGDNSSKPNPLAGVADVAVTAQVKEYISDEMGILHLEAPVGGLTVNAVIFHINQLWVRGQSNTFKQFVKVQDKTLQDHLPVGCRVMVNSRSIAANPHSGLRYQAVIFWKVEEGESKMQKLPSEYLTMFSPIEERETLVDELDEHHDGMKSILSMNSSVLSKAFRPVHIILNGLPGDWNAQVVAAVGSDFGIVKVSHRIEGKELGQGVRMLYVLFHLEDVWDFNGQPSKLRQGLSIQTLLHSWVDLTARSICDKLKPDRVMEVQRRLTFEYREFGAIPLLQAIHVCIKTGRDAQVNVPSLPHPTVLRDDPGCFSGGLNQMTKASAFYLNATLSCKLDNKVKEFLQTPGKLPGVPYEKVLHAIAERRTDEEKLLSSLKNKLDTSNNARFLYGSFPTELPQLTSEVAGKLPEVVWGIGVKVMFLHRRKLRSDCGVGMIKLEVAGQMISSLVLFELSRYKFFSPPDCFAQDLTNIIPINSTDMFFVHATLAKPDSKIPYVALAIWNEDLRRDLRKEVPLRQPESHWDRKVVAESCNKIVDGLLRNVKSGEPKSKKLKSGISKSSSDISTVDGNRDRRGSKDVSKKPNIIPIPEDILRVSTDVKTVDLREICQKDGEIVKELSNLSGEVLHILSDHLAIVSFTHETSSMGTQRILCSSDDVFNLHPKSEFKTSADLMAMSARSKNTSLRGLLQRGQKVKVNAVPMISSLDYNAAKVYYCSSGLVIKMKQEIPVTCELTKSYVTDDFNVNFMKVVRGLNQQGESDSELTVPPQKFKSIITGPARTAGQAKRIAKSIISTEFLEKTEVEQPQFVTPQLPTPVSTKKPPHKPIVWKPIVNNVYGKVLKVIDKNYGIAVGFVTVGSHTDQCVPFQVLFDTYDVYIGENDCNELGKKLQEVMQVGDYVKFNAVKVDTGVEVNKEGSRDIQYLATALITAKTNGGIRAIQIPNKAARIVNLDQVTTGKVDNFKVVVNVMNSTKIAPAEDTILSQIKSGQFAHEVLDNHGPQNSVSVEPEVESDEEVTVVENAASEDNEADDELTTVTKELTPSELRKLIMSYIDLVNKIVEKNPRTKINLEKFSNSVKIDKDLQFIQRFLVALGQKCLKTDKKGLKVGHVFVTQTQVTLIKSKGVVTEDHIEGNSDKVTDITEKYNSQDLRKFLMAFIKFMGVNRKLGTNKYDAKNQYSMKDIGDERGVSEEEALSLFKAIQEKCKNAPANKAGVKEGFKLQNHFITPTWVMKFIKFQF